MYADCPQPTDSIRATHCSRPARLLLLRDAAHARCIRDLTAKGLALAVSDPEVARLYEADFDNLEIATRYLFPENLPLLEGLRRRHQSELSTSVWRRPTCTSAAPTVSAPFQIAARVPTPWSPPREEATRPAMRPPWPSHEAAAFVAFSAATFA